jgi:hypothetical protein
MSAGNVPGDDLIKREKNAFRGLLKGFQLE